MATSRLALRQEIGRLTGDMLKVTATAIGTTTTFIDAMRLARSDGNMVGRIGWMASGTSANLGSMIRVTSSDKATFKVTFADTALASATAVADTMELWNRNGQGFYPDDVNAEINSALNIVAGQITTPDEDETQTFDCTNPYLTIPADWHFFGGAMYQRDTETDVWLEIPNAESHMIVDARNRTVRLKGPIAGKAHDCLVRLYGDIASSTLSTDAATTSCDAEWLTNYVASRLLLQQMSRASSEAIDDVSTRYAQCLAREKESRGKARNRPQGSAVRLW